MSRGRTVASSALACAAERSFFAPPGMSSSSRWWTWDILRVCSSPRDRRRSTKIRSTASCSSLTTGRSPLIRVPTSATEWASVASVFRPCPVAKTRARADSFGGTSTTVSPSARSRLATWRPIPWQPSMAQTRLGHAWTWRRIASCPSRSVPKRPLPRMDSSLVMISIVTDRLWGSIPMTTRGAASFMVSSELEPVGVVELGGQRYFELGQTPLEPLPPWRRPGMRRPNESHTGVSSRNESDNPERLDRASSDTGPGVNETSSR